MRVARDEKLIAVERLDVIEAKSLARKASRKSRTDPKFADALPEWICNGPCA
jgi:glycerol-3-phosphate responsive antiterminator